MSFHPGSPVPGSLHRGVRLAAERAVAFRTLDRVGPADPGGPGSRRGAGVILAGGVRAPRAPSCTGKQDRGSPSSSQGEEEALRPHNL